MDVLLSGVPGCLLHVGVRSLLREGVHHRESLFVCLLCCRTSYTWESGLAWTVKLPSGYALRPPSSATIEESLGSKIPLQSLRVRVSQSFVDVQGVWGCSGGAYSSLHPPSYGLTDVYRSTSFSCIHFSVDPRKGTSRVASLDPSNWEVAETWRSSAKSCTCCPAHRESLHWKLWAGGVR